MLDGRSVHRITLSGKAARMEPYLLTEEHVEAAGDLLAAAFFSAPGMTYQFPDPTRRARWLPPFFTAMTRLAIRHGEVVVLGSPLQAVALWLRSGRERPAETQFGEVRMEAVAALMDEGESERRQTYTHHFEAMHERVMDRPHWYLSFLAVDPAHRALGMGTLLMRYTLDQVIPAGVTCYLDSVDARNLPFYERLGFRVVEAGVVPGSQLRAWALRRG